MQKFCQSCGMPMSKDPLHGGSNMDGTISTEYCSYCYKGGAFTSPDLTPRQMQAFCIRKMQEKGTPKPLAWLLTRNIPKLRRWQTAQTVGKTASSSP